MVWQCTSGYSYFTTDSDEDVQKAGFDGYFTNHSLRATAATRLYAAGVDEQLIAEKTGYRCSAIREYKRTSEEQQQSVSDLIQKQSTVSASESKK